MGKKKKMTDHHLAVFFEHRMRQEVFEKTGSWPYQVNLNGETYWSHEWSFTNSLTGEVEPGQCLLCGKLLSNYGHEVASKRSPNSGKISVKKPVCLDCASNLRRDGWQTHLIISSSEKF